jgi:hypothetical protein
MNQDKEELMFEMLDSLIELLNTARLETDAKMLDSYARLVHETWNALKNGEDPDENEEGVA